MSAEYITESGRGRLDSAYSPQTMQGPLGPSLALLGSQAVHPRIQDWFSNQDTPELDIAARAYEFLDDPLSIPRSLRDNERSMALLMQPASALDSSRTSTMPSLSSGPSTRDSSSIPSSVGHVAIRSGILDSQGCYIGAASVALHNTSDWHPKSLPCLFNFLGCEKIFEEPVGWYEHSKSHLHGKPPPSHLRCPYKSCSWKTSQPDGESAWNERWKHLSLTHDVLGDPEVLCEKRDSQFFDYLWSVRLISPVQLQELKGTGRLGMDKQPFVTTERSERRRHRAGKQTIKRSANAPRYA